jgi:hypothetical protein
VEKGQPFRCRTLLGVEGLGFWGPLTAGALTLGGLGFGGPDRQTVTRVLHDPCLAAAILPFVPHPGSFRYGALSHTFSPCHHTR